MKTLPKALLVAVLALTAAAAVPPVGPPPPAIHFALASSVPADKSTVHAVGQIRLVFTQEPAEGSLSVRLLDADGDPVPTSAPAKDAADAKAFSVKPDAAPAPGRYTVSWRGMGADGHVVRGDITFTVMAH